MKNANYETHFVRVIDYLYAHLDDDIDLAALAEVACLSEFHWHRIYQAHIGESVFQTIRRLRLQRAAEALANSTTPIDEIRKNASYGSREAFSRAFKDMFSRSPSDYRSSGPHAVFLSARQARNTQEFDVSVEQIETQHCIAVEHIGSIMLIEQAMTTLFMEAQEQQLLAAQPDMIAVFLDDPTNANMRDMRSLACLVQDVERPVSSRLMSYAVERATYVRLAYTGPYAAMKSAYDWLATVWLPGSGFEPADLPNFERYLNSPREVPQEELRTDIYFPIVPVRDLGAETS